MQHDDSSGQPPLPEITGYRLRRVLGMGGMSTIYLGEQLSLRREVAELRFGSVQRWEPETAPESDSHDEDLGPNDQKRIVSSSIGAPWPDIILSNASRLSASNSDTMVQ